MPLILALTVALPASAQLVGNTLDLTEASAPNGSFVTVTLDLANEDAVGGIQANILFDAGVAAFNDISVTGRGSGMTAEGRVTEAGHLRVVLFFSDSGSLISDTGPVAELSFSMQGVAGESTLLTFEEVILSDPDGLPLTGSGTSGNLTVSPPDSPPALKIAALKNPGHTPIVMIMVTIVGGSGDAPSVVANGSLVSMTPLGDGVFQGQYHAPASLSSLTISATDTNAHGLGTSQTILALP